MNDFESDFQSLALPANTWESLLSNFTSPAARAQNGADYLSFLDSFFSDWSDSYSFLLGAYPHLPLLYPILSSYARTAPTGAHPGVQAIQSSLEAASRNEALQHIRQIEDSFVNFDYDPRDHVKLMKLLGVAMPALPPIHDRFGSWINVNMSQFHRKAQQLYSDLFFGTIQEMIEALNRWCERNGAEWALRPPIAFPSAHHSELQRIPASQHIESYGYYCTYAANATNHQLRLRLNQDVFNMFEPQDSLMAHYNWWYNFNLGAAIRYVDSGDVIGLTHKDMLGLHLHRPDRELYYIDNHAPTISPFDKRVYLIDAGNITDQPIWDSLGPRLLEAITVGISIMAATVSLGKGHKKLNWINTPISADYIRFVARYQAMLMKEIRDNV